MIEPSKQQSIVEMLGISAMNPFEKTFAVFLLLFMFSMILSIAVLQIAAGILMMTWLSRIAFDKDYHYRKTPLDLPVVVLAGIRTISVFTSIHPEVSLSYLWKELPFYAMFFVFAQNIDVTNKRFMKVLFWAIIASALIGTVYGIHLHIITDFQERAKSITSGYMTFSMFLCALIVIVIPLINHLSKRPWIVWSVLGVLFTGLLATLGRTHIALGLIAVLFYAILRYRMLLVIVPVLVIGALILSPGLRTRSESILSLKAGNDGDRGVLTRDGLEKIAIHPFTGYGPYTFPFVFSHYNEVTDDKISGWHDDYLQTYLESGIFAFGALLWVVFISLKIPLQRIRLKERSWENDLAFALAGMMIVFYASAFLGASAFDLITGQFYRFGLAACVCLSSFTTGRA